MCQNGEFPGGAGAKSAFANGNFLHASPTLRTNHHHHLTTPSPTTMDVSSRSSPCPEDEISSNANTEDSLLGSRKSSETIISDVTADTQCYHLPDEKYNCGPSTCTLAAGILLTLMGVCSLIWTPFEVLMTERLRMTRVFPPYQWWKDPPDEVLLRVYVFNVTNADDFISGRDSKLNLEEIGPIVFREKLEHYNVSFNENGTLSYVARRSAMFLPEMNTIDLNATLVTPNLALLGMASYLWDAGFLTKFGFNVLIRRFKSQPIVNISIYDYLWHFTDPLVDAAQNLMPALVPVNNLGILSRIYSDFEDHVTVYVGPSSGHERFFLIDKYDGTQSLPGYGGSCPDSLMNATEGVTYAQFLTKDSVLRYWRKTMCRVTPLIYNNSLIKYGLEAYKFILPNSTYNRTEPESLDCYISRPALVDGLSDVSKCYYNFPMAASFPHFLYGDHALNAYVTGLTPNKDKHESFVIVEPLTGIPMESRARSQSNLIVRKLSGLNTDILRFSETVIPMFWAEYNQVGLPWYISALVYFTVNIVRPAQTYASTLLLLTGIICAVCGLFAVRRRRRGRLLAINRALHFVGGGASGGGLVK